FFFQAEDGIRDFHVTGVQTCALPILENLLQGNPGVQAVFAHNDEMALGAIEAIQSSGKNIPIIGFDGNDDALKSIEEGKLTGTRSEERRVGKKCRTRQSMSH